MSKFTLSDFFREVFKTCYRTSSQRSSDTAEKLEVQTRMHNARIKSMEQTIASLEAQKRQYVAQKRIEDAKKVVIERHKVLIRKRRCEQLRDCCDRILQNIQVRNSVPYNPCMACFCLFDCLLFLCLWGGVRKGACPLTPHRIIRASRIPFLYLPRQRPRFVKSTWMKYL